MPRASFITPHLARFDALLTNPGQSGAERRDGVLEFARRKPLYIKGLAALTLAGFACFGFGVWVGLWGSISASVVSLGGVGLRRLRATELDAEILALRKETDRMREMAALSVGPFR